MKKTNFIKFCTAILFVFTVFALTSNVTAQDDVSKEKIQEAIEGLSSYADLPSSINCKKAKIKAEKIICGSEYLLLMEKLDTRAAVYAYENATSTELPHNSKTVKEQSLITQIRKLKTEKEIREAYIENTNASLGGTSPYFEDVE